MGCNDRPKSADMSQPGKLIQVAGDAFQLRHKVEVFAPHPLLHSPLADQLPDDLGRSAARCAGELAKPEIKVAVEPCADDVTLSDRCFQ